MAIPVNACADPGAAVKLVVVMGVSGCGKSTVGQALAQALLVPFVEGDDLHPPRSVALMAAGTPLTDADRQGWLVSVGQCLADAAARQQGVVVSCSALKRPYRNQLRAAAPSVRFVYLHGSHKQLAQRLADRKGHYMPTSLLQSQLETLEPPTPDERAIDFDFNTGLDEIVAGTRAALLDQLQP